MDKYQTSEGGIPPVLHILQLAFFGFVIWQTVGLIALKRFHRWFAVVFLVGWTISLFWKSPLLFQNPAVRPVRVALFLSLFVVLNLLCAWGLSRKSFRENAVQFVTERRKKKDAEMLKRASEERLRKEVGQ